MIAVEKTDGSGQRSPNSKIALGYAAFFGTAAGMGAIVIIFWTRSWQASLDAKYVYCRAHAPLMLGKSCGLGSSTDAAILLWTSFVIALGCIGIATHQFLLEVLPPKREQLRRRGHYNLAIAALMVALSALFVWLESLVALHL